MIQPSSPYHGSPRLSGTPSSAASAAERPSISGFTAADQLSFAGSDSLRAALAASPEIRPEVVMEGRRLAIDPNYPPLQIIEELAKMLLHSADPSDRV